MGTGMQGVAPQGTTPTVERSSTGTQARAASPLEDEFVQSTTQRLTVYLGPIARVVARNVAQARRVLPDVPLLLENVAWTFRWPEDEMPEGAFYAEVARATGCELLLDVANLYANALNSGIAPAQALRDHPLDRVGMVHVATVCQAKTMPRIAIIVRKTLAKSPFFRAHLTAAGMSS